MQDTTKADHWIWSLKGLIIVIAVYSFLHTVIRIAASGVIGQDDVIGNLFTQVLAPGYTPRQGPLYDWMLWSVQQFTGPNVISFLILKYALVATMLIFIYLAAREVLGSRMWAFFAALSVSLMYQIGWNVHEGVTHTAALMATIAASFWAFIRLTREQNITSYIVFGILLGLGFLSKHTFGLFLLVLLAGSMLQPSLRRSVLHPLFIVSLLTALLVTTPFLLWIIERTAELAAETRNAAGVEGKPYLQRLLTGIPSIITSPLGFLFPLIVILPLVFPGFMKTWWKQTFTSGNNETTPDYIRLICHMMVISLALIALVVISLGITNMKERYMHPFFLVAVIGLVGIAMRSCSETKVINRYMTVILVFAVVVFGVRVSNLIIGDPLCGKCREFVPYGKLADHLKEKGYRGGTIITGYRHLAGNMRRHFPQDRIISVSGPEFNPQRYDEQRRNGSIVAVWDPNINRGKVPGPVRRAMSDLGINQIPEPETVKVPWDHLWKKEGYRHSTWKVILISADTDKKIASFPGAKSQ